MDLKVKLGKGIILPNPVCAASGTFGYGEEMVDFLNLNNLGAIFTKAVTLKPREGNPPPRICEVTGGMLNAIGLANIGVESFIKDKIKFLKKLKSRIFVNVAGSSIKEYVEVIKKLNDSSGIDGYELNIS
ncbi:MAG: dihydroorotate dehydrogenase, partial [bacterium]